MNNDLANLQNQLTQGVVENFTALDDNRVYFLLRLVERVSSDQTSFSIQDLLAVTITYPDKPGVKEILERLELRTSFFPENPPTPEELKKIYSYLGVGLGRNIRHGKITAVEEQGQHLFSSVR